MADKIKYYDQQEKLAKQKSTKQKSTGTTIPYESPEDLKKLKGHLDTLPKTIKITTPEQDKAYYDRLNASYEKYKKTHHPIYDTPTDCFILPTPSIMFQALLIALYGIIKSTYF
jgi:tRNA C32,U32 (ribose-2'-O)-methylase TrmJ